MLKSIVTKVADTIKKYIKIKLWIMDNYRAISAKKSKSQINLEQVVETFKITI